jgi:hypothetical protein
VKLCTAPRRAYPRGHNAAGGRYFLVLMYIGLRISDTNPQIAKFAEFLFHALR